MYPSRTRGVLSVLRTNNHGQLLITAMSLCPLMGGACGGRLVSGQRWSPPDLYLVDALRCIAVA
jgi:hypothetical protein